MCFIIATWKRLVLMPSSCLPAPARYFEFATDNISSLVCRAGGLYPSPSLELYRYLENDTRSVLISQQAKTILEGEHGEYTIETSAQVNEDDLRKEIVTHYECVLTIPGSNYSTSKVLAFQKGKKPLSSLWEALRLPPPALLTERSSCVCSDPVAWVRISVNNRKINLQEGLINTLHQSVSIAHQAECGLHFTIIHHHDHLK